MRYPAHEAADLFPLLGDQELRELADDIMAHGLIEPVRLYDDPEHGWLSEADVWRMLCDIRGLHRCGGARAA